VRTPRREFRRVRRSRSHRNRLPCRIRQRSAGAFSISHSTALPGNQRGVTVVCPLPFLIVRNQSDAAKGHRRESTPKLPNHPSLHGIREVLGVKRGPLLPRAGEEIPRTASMRSGIRTRSSAPTGQPKDPWLHEFAIANQPGRAGRVIRRPDPRTYLARCPHRVAAWALV